MSSSGCAVIYTAAVSDSTSCRKASPPMPSFANSACYPCGTLSPVAARACLKRLLPESRMREIRTSGSMSGRPVVLCVAVRSTLLSYRNRGLPHRSQPRHVLKIRQRRVATYAAGPPPRPSAYLRNSALAEPRPSGSGIGNFSQVGLRTVASVNLDIAFRQIAGEETRLLFAGTVECNPNSHLRFIELFLHSRFVKVGR